MRGIVIIKNKNEKNQKAVTSKIIATEKKTSKIKIIKIKTYSRILNCIKKVTIIDKVIIFKSFQLDFWMQKAQLAH